MAEDSHGNDPVEDIVVHRISQLLADQPKVEGQWFRNQVVPIDGRKFVSCHFENCTIFVTTGSFSITECRFTGCLFSFANPVLKAIKVLHYVQLTGGYLSAEAWGKIPEAVRPSLNADNTITVE
jgi:hypothetical protein